MRTSLSFRHDRGKLVEVSRVEGHCDTCLLRWMSECYPSMEVYTRVEGFPCARYVERPLRRRPTKTCWDCAHWDESCPGAEGLVGCESFALKGE